jgi:hypothetical protein
VVVSIAEVGSIAAVNECKVTQTEIVVNQKKNTVLLVDDEPDLCVVYQTVLEDAAIGLVGSRSIFL